MKGLLSRILVFILLVVYLVIPFKHQFLDSLHFISHISLHENPFHHHGNTFHDHHHHHGLLEMISASFEEMEGSHDVPDQLENYKFEQAFPSACLQLNVVHPSVTIELIVPGAITVLAAPFFQVPTPPP